METISDQEIQQRLAELPADVQQAIRSNNVGERMQNIAATYGLHIDQQGAVQDAAYLVMLGFADPQTFASDIASGANVPRETAERIAADISEQLFMPIRESMRIFMEHPQYAPPQVSAQATTPASLSAPAATPAYIAPSASSAAPGPISAPAAKALSAPAAPLATAQAMLTAPTVSAPTKSETLPPRPASPQPSANTAAPQKKYAVDPYREPIGP